MNSDFYVSRLDSHYANRSQVYPISVIFKEIESGKTTVRETAETVGDKSLAGITQYGRDLLLQNNVDAYAEQKKSMPAFSPAASFDSRSRTVDDMSGVVSSEYDNVPDVPHAKAELAQNPHVLACFVTLGGSGLRVLSVPDPKPASDDYVLAWIAAKFLFDDIVGVEADAGNRTPTSLCALVHDPQIYINPNVKAFDWGHIDAEDLAEVVKTRANFRDSIGFAHDISEEHISALADMEYKENGWGKTLIPCILSDHEHDGWHSKRNGTGVYRAKYHYTFHCFKCEASVRVDRYVDPKDLPPIYAFERMPEAFAAYQEKYPDENVVDVKTSGEGLRIRVSVKCPDGQVREVHAQDYLLYHIGIDRPLAEWTRDPAGRFTGKYKDYWRSLNKSLREFTGQTESDRTDYLGGFYAQQGAEKSASARESQAEGNGLASVSKPNPDFSGKVSNE